MAGLTASRYGLLALGGIGLLAGLTGALVLLGVPMPAPARGLGADHGVLMTLGFLGTLISLERAVALGRGWGYLAPLLTGAGGLALVAGAPAVLPLALFTGGAGVFVAMYIAFDRIERSLHTSVQALGALAWLGAGLLLLSGRAAAEVVPWLAAFLVLTIAGERLELSRLVQLTSRARIGFVAAAAIFGTGVAMSAATPDIGMRVAGIGLVALAAWLTRNDVARRTVRMAGTPRFVALSLLSGYAWLAVGGACWLVFGAVSSGPAYDAMLHAVFLGFVISMVFGHAPIILPAVLGTPLPYRPRFYAHLGLLHVGLVLRIVGGDLLGSDGAWRAGGILNVTALLLFVASSAVAIGVERRASLRVVPAGSP
ncbi:MAG TPA: hypothetical protein VFN76_05930 [Candidatus Limnocylindria bacterium]|nr:hypothetical protein [Candidatus Limnocylindria bacterium]